MVRQYLLLKKHLLFVIIYILLHASSYATWSIILIDPRTKEIGIAGASCTYNCYGIGKVIPNMGAVIVQAMSNSQAREKGVEMILAEAEPEQIIMAMRDSAFDPERQQYAIVTIKYIDRPGTYSGDSIKFNKGALTASGISVQGNTLANEQELKIIFDAVVKGQKDSLHIADILMNALEAGSISGGDRRCGEQRATSAFIMVCKPDSRKSYLNLNIFGQVKGGQNAVSMLRRKFEKWKRKHSL
jgi:uncharacterized Ntn-hydrolase superfamily protein